MAAHCVRCPSLLLGARFTLVGRSARTQVDSHPIMAWWRYAQMAEADGIDARCVRCPSLCSGPVSLPLVVRLEPRRVLIPSGVGGGGWDSNPPWTHRAHHWF